jgi:hypothetical protein
MSKIQFIHRRKFNLFDLQPSSRGGLTVAYQEVKPGLIEYSIARCSTRDNFNKKMGRDIATGRLAVGKSASEVGMTLEEFREKIYSQPV